MRQNLTILHKKEIFAYYLKEVVCIEQDLISICELAKHLKIRLFAVLKGQPTVPSIYCSLIYIDPGGIIQPTHRKLMPTYEERLAWSIGDGKCGLKVHSLEGFTVGGLELLGELMPARTPYFVSGKSSCGGLPWHRPK
jgi:nitrilase